MMTTMAATRRMMTRLLVLMFDVALLALNDPGAEVQKSKEAKMKAAMAGGKSRKKTLGSHFVPGALEEPDAASGEK